MNQPEGYVLVQIKQLAQWRDWANNVAAWSRQADRSSEVARLKASISSAMISATLPPASAAGERLTDEQIEEAAPAKHDNAHWFKQGAQWARAALATKPQAEQEATPPARTVQDSAVLAYLDGLSDDAAAHIYPSDLEKCSNSECVVEVCSVRAGNGIERTVPLFSRSQVVEALNAARTRGDEVGKSS